MSTSVFLASRTARTLFEIGGSCMAGFPVDVLADRSELEAELRRRLPHRSDGYVGWLCDVMWGTAVASGWDVRIVMEPHHDPLVERGYTRSGTYLDGDTGKD